MPAKVRIFAERQQRAGSESGETGLNGIPVTVICPSKNDAGGPVLAPKKCTAPCLQGVSIAGQGFF